MPNIVSAQYDQSGGVFVVYEGQKPDTVINVPPDPDNREYKELQAWVAEGNTIEPYVPPPEADPEPTIQDLMARVDDLAKRVTALERKKPK